MYPGTMALGGRTVCGGVLREYEIPLSIEKSNTEKSITYGSSTDSIPFRETAAARPPERKGRDAMSVTEIENYRELILENIEYDCLKQRYPLYLDDLNEIVELMVETVCARRKTTRISGADFPHEIVRSRFLKLGSSHIEFVMDCLQKNTTQVRNMNFHYCTGEVCHTPKELFDLLADDYRTYLEIELTKGKREVTEDDEREADALCKRYLERWKEELE